MPRESKLPVDSFSVRVPAGAPLWVTPELIAHTIRVWQPFYADRLIPEDALEIIMGADRMFDFVVRGCKNEEIRCSSQSQQS